MKNESKDMGPRVAAKTKESRIDILRRIVKDKQAEKIDGKLMDLFTASMLVQVYEALSPSNHDKFERLPLMNLVNFGWSMMKKASTEPVMEKESETGMKFGEEPKKASEKIAVQFREGDKFEFTGGGTRDGQKGVIIPMNKIPTDGKGIPRVNQGHYKPVSKDDVAVKYEDGDLDVVNKRWIKKVASELKSRRATDFPTQNALEKYLDEHPGADKSNHQVVKNILRGEPGKPSKSQPGTVQMKKQEEDSQNKMLNRFYDNNPKAKGADYKTVNDLMNLKDKVNDLKNTDFGDKRNKLQDSIHRLIGDIDKAGYGDAAKELSESEWKKYKTSSDHSNLKSRRAMYWGGPDRIYRLTREEQDSGSAACPKCKCNMGLEPFTRSEKLYTCESCGFKVPTSKTTTTQITIKQQDGEVDVDVTTSKDKKTRRGSMTMIS